MGVGYGFGHFANARLCSSRSYVSGRPPTRALALTPRSPDSAVLFAALEAVVDPRDWAGLEPFIVSEEQDHFMEVAMSNGWVSQLVNALEKLVAASVSVRIVHS